MRATYQDRDITAAGQGNGTTFADHHRDGVIADAGFRCSRYPEECLVTAEFPHSTYGLA